MCEADRPGAIADLLDEASFSLAAIPGLGDGEYADMEDGRCPLLMTDDLPPAERDCHLACLALRAAYRRLVRDRLAALLRSVFPRVAPALAAFGGAVGALGTFDSSVDLWRYLF
jgi:hypothetical protein